MLISHMWTTTRKIDINERKTRQFGRMYKIKAKCNKNVWVLLLYIFWRPIHGRAFKCLVKIQPIVQLTYGSFKIKTITSDGKIAVVRKSRKKWVNLFFLPFYGRYLCDYFYRNTMHVEIMELMVSLTAHAASTKTRTFGCLCWFALRVASVQVILHHIKISSG